MKEKLKSLSYIIVGNTLIAFAISTLVLENNIIAGGVTGFGLIMNYFTDAKVATVVFITNIILFLLALFFIGIRFTLSTLVSTFLFPILLNIFESYDKIHHYCTDILLSSVIAGGLIGTGIGLILKANASTGGTDIIGIIVNKKLSIPVFVTLNIIDLCILILQMPFSSIDKVLYGFIVVFLTSFTLNKTLNFNKSIVKRNYNETQSVYN